MLTSHIKEEAISKVKNYGNSISVSLCVFSVALCVTNN